MSGPLSLKQLIAVNAADLAGVHVSLAAIGLEDVDLSARIASNATTISANAAALAALTTSAGGTQSALDEATAGFTNAAATLDEGLTTEVQRALAAEAELGNALSAEVTHTTDRVNVLVDQIIAEQQRATLAEGNELIRATAAEVALDIRVDGEAAARAAGITAEATARAAAISAEVARAGAAEVAVDNRVTNEVAARIASVSAEAGARVAGDAKMCFAIVMECDGLLAADSYPFACGAGVPSSPAFGVQVPMGYKFIGYGAQCVTSATDLYVNLSFEGYMYNSATPDWTVSGLIGGSKFASTLIPSAPGRPAGHVCIKVVSSLGQPDSDARYRITMYFQSVDGF